MTFDDLTSDDLITFELLTGINVTKTLEQVVEFMNNSAPQIRSFFLGTTDTIFAQEFKQLDIVTKDVENTINDIKNNREQLQLYKHWIVLEYLEDSLTNFNTLNNFSFWARSNRDINVYAGQIEVDYLQRQSQTLEQIELEIGSTDSDTSWYQTAIRNSLTEEKYSSQGGTQLKIFLRNTPTTFLESVLGVIDSGIKSFGIDIAKKIEFQNDDIVTLSNKDTLLQSANILLNLRKGDNPRLPDLGIDQVSILGRSKGSFLFPIILRQIVEVFSTDDTFAAVEIGKISFQDDALFIDVTISSRYKETIEGLIQL